MDLLAQHEAFLRAIFDAPDDDTPRLVYADFLEENGEAERAEFIRVTCEQQRLVRTATTREELDRIQFAVSRRIQLQQSLSRTHPVLFGPHAYYDRGFLPVPSQVRLPVAALAGPHGPSEIAVQIHPEWFGCIFLKFTDGVIGNSTQVEVLYESPVFAHVSSLELRGEEEHMEPPAGAAEGGGYFVYVPVISNAGVAALVQHRGARRLTVLDLRYNNLDNDAARAIVRSPFLDNLERLQLLDGNRLRGKVWQQVIERFGEDVVG